jgi:hypothetical protein
VTAPAGSALHHDATEQSVPLLPHDSARGLAEARGPGAVTMRPGRGGERPVVPEAVGSNPRARRDAFAALR